jgi:hypothetical protein
MSRLTHARAFNKLSDSEREWVESAVLDSRAKPSLSLEFALAGLSWISLDRSLLIRDSGESDFAQGRKGGI